MKKRILAIISMLALLLTTALAVFPASAAIVESDWLATNPNAPEDYAYAFAFVGDTQVLSMLDAGNIPEEYNNSDANLTNNATVVYPEGDTKGSTNYMETLYGWIADNAASKKIKYVFGLGDITENLVCAAGTGTGNSTTTDTEKQNNKEWSISSAAISQLNGVVPYSMARGNHDVSAGFRKYFDTSAYQNMPGTTFIDGKEFANNGSYSNASNNLAREFTIGEDKYLMITLDYAPNDHELAWAKGIMDNAAYANHKAIIITHAYLDSQGALINENDATHNTSGDNMWNNYFSKCANLSMVVCGHVGVTDPVITYKTGDAGNVVTQILIDPQNDDIGTKTKNTDATTGITTTTIEVNPTGMVALFYFSEDGKIIDIEYVSTIRAAKGLSPYLKEKNQQRLDYRFDVFNKLSDYGYEYYNVSAPTFTAPTLDGAINYNEYSTVRRNVAMGDSTVSEYFAYDESKLYFGFAYKLPDASVTPMTSFRFTALDANDANPFSNTDNYTYVGTTPSQSNPKGYMTSSDGKIPGAYDVYQTVDADDGMLYLEISVAIDTIQEVFGFKKQTIAYQFIDRTSGNTRDCAVSSELANALAEDFGTVTSLPQYVKYTLDAKTAFKSLGHNDFYIGSAAKTATVDGVVGATEYSFNNTVAYNDATLLSKPVDGDIEEYFAHDANNFYVGFVLNNAQYVGKSFSFLIQSLSPDTYQAVCRYNFQITINEDGSLTIGGFRGGPSALTKDVLAIAEGEYTVAAKVDTTNNTTTYEVSFTKAGLKRILKTDDLTVVGYSLTIPNAAGSWRNWYYGNNSTLKSQVLGVAAQWQGRTATDNAFLPQYVQLSDAPVIVNEDISTYETASIRLSSPSGLRFGTEISTDYIDYLIETYGKENVSVGTLITPADLLGSTEFTKEALDAAGIKYLDVKATIDSPYKVDGDVNIYTGSIVSIKNKNLDRDFAGIGYVAYEYNGVTTYVYSQTYATRSVSTVARNALDDTSTTMVGEYVHAIDVKGDGTYVIYSKYSTDERAILSKLLISNIKDPTGSDVFE